MTRFIVGRVLGLIPTLLVIVTLSFFVIRLAPGSPFTTERGVPKEVVEELQAHYGFDRPFQEQLFNYLANLASGNLGLSTKYPQRTVNEIIAAGFPPTLLIGSFALLWALLFGVSAGIIGAMRQNTVFDYGAMSLAMVGISLPTFVLGPLLALVFGLTLYVLPPAGWGAARHVVLPAVTLGTVYAAYVARLTRGGMLEVVRADFVRTARAKGLSEQLIIWRHMLRGGLLPVVTFLGPAIANILVGSVVVEKIFAVPGIGPYFVDAAFNRDYFLVMGIVVVYSAFLLVMNLIVDVLYGFLDPRVRYT
ncbi:MAG: ABC transporter permease subunit [Myxococcales bacterium]|nr:ABC transporter permease subunit [Myxococcales bacterium]MDD9967322.1 ABC transporter permease subunit [Myxococcales bacterium]